MHEEVLIEVGGLNKQGGSVWIGRGGGFLKGMSCQIQDRSIIFFL